MDATVSGVALRIGGWAGLAIGLVYWGLDSIGAFDRPIKNTDMNVWKYIYIWYKYDAKNPIHN